MLDFCRALATNLSFLYSLGRLLMVAALGLFIYELVSDVSPKMPDKYLVPSGVLALWLLVLTTFISTFSRAPSSQNWSESKINWFTNRMIRSYYYLLALLTVCLTFGALFVTFRLIRIIV